MGKKNNKNKGRKKVPAAAKSKPSEEAPEADNAPNQAIPTTASPTESTGSQMSADAAEEPRQTEDLKAQLRAEDEARFLLDEVTRRVNPWASPDPILFEPAAGLDRQIAEHKLREEEAVSAASLAAEKKALAEAAQAEHALEAQAEAASAYARGLVESESARAGLKGKQQEAQRLEEARARGAQAERRRLQEAEALVEAEFERIQEDERAAADAVVIETAAAEAEAAAAEAAALEAEAEAAVAAMAAAAKAQQQRAARAQAETLAEAAEDAQAARRAEMAKVEALLARTSAARHPESIPAVVVPRLNLTAGREEAASAMLALEEEAEIDPRSKAEASILPPFQPYFSPISPIFCSIIGGHHELA